MTEWTALRVTQHALPQKFSARNFLRLEQRLRVTSSTARQEMHVKRRMRLKCDGTRAETRFRLSAKRTSPFKSAGASVQSTTGSRGVRISGSNTGYTKFRRSVKDTGYPPHSPVSPSLPLPCVTVCHHVSAGLYLSLHHETFKEDGLTMKSKVLMILRNGRTNLLNKKASHHRQLEVKYTRAHCVS